MTNPTTVTWVAPTTNTDGSAIAAGEITGYVVGIRNTAATGSQAGTYPTTIAVNGAATLQASLPALAAGTYAAAAQAVGPQNSAWSAEVTFTVVESPNPPTGLAVK